MGPTNFNIFNANHTNNMNYANQKIDFNSSNRNNDLYRGQS